jgi:hypothetical protein
MMAKGRDCSGGGAGAGRSLWRPAARLYSVRRAGVAGYRIKQAKSGLLKLRFFIRMETHMPVAVSDTPPPRAQPIISQVLYTLSSAGSRYHPNWSPGEPGNRVGARSRLKEEDRR